MVRDMKKVIKKATIQSLSADELLRAMGISKKKEAEILKRYAESRRRALQREQVRKNEHRDAAHAT